MDNIDLTDLFTTKTEANDFLARLTSVSEKFFQTGFTLEKALYENFGVNKTDKLLMILRQNNVATESLPAVKDFFFILMAKISSLPVLTLTLAFEPQEQTLVAVSEWFFINMHKQMLFEINVDKNIIAGAHIKYNGKFFDFSVRSTFEKILTTYMERFEHPNAKVLPQQPATSAIAKPPVPPAPAPTVQQNAPDPMIGTEIKKPTAQITNHGHTL